MKKVLIVGAASVCLAMTGCANQGGGMTRGQQAAVGAGAGAALGALVGGLMGGGKGAAIGAAGGALLGGLATYALASDPFTQSANQQAQVWQRDMAGQTEVVKASHTTENGQERQQIDVQKTIIPVDKMQSKGRLQTKAKTSLKQVVKDTAATGGGVLVLCPGDATSAILSDIESTGAKVKQDPTMSGGYAIVVARNARDLAV